MDGGTGACGGLGGVAEFFDDAGGWGFAAWVRFPEDVYRGGGWEGWARAVGWGGWGAVFVAWEGWGVGGVCRVRCDGGALARVGVGCGGAGGEVCDWCVSVWGGEGCDCGWCVWGWWLWEGD